MPRVFVRPEAVDADRVRFDAAEAHHLRRVLRLRSGAVVEATDGTGRLYTVRLVGLDAEGGWGTIEGRAEPGRESPCAITLAQAILKGDRMSWLVQKATELGVARIIPMETARIVARLRERVDRSPRTLREDRARGRQAVRARRRPRGHAAAPVRGHPARDPGAGRRVGLLGRRRPSAHCRGARD